MHGMGLDWTYGGAAWDRERKKRMNKRRDSFSPNPPKSGRRGALKKQMVSAVGRRRISKGGKNLGNDE